MAESWVLQEMETAELKDARMNARLCEVLSQLSQQPAQSIPSACGGSAEMSAAYRFFDNPKATFERILAPHAEQTRVRMRSQSTVLLVQDTTELDLSRPSQQVQGAGPLDGGSRRGLFLHPLHAFTAEGTPLGTLQAILWARTQEPQKTNSERSRAERAAIPLEQKESFRWIQSFRYAQEQAAQCPQTQLICIADSEADMYELFVEPSSIDWIIRGCYDRTLQPPEEQTALLHVREHLLAQPVLYTHSIQVRGRQAKLACDTRKRRQPRKSRQAQVQVRSATLSLKAPWRPQQKLPNAQLNVVLVTEIDPPQNDEPIEWVLLTSLPVQEPSEVHRVIELYCVRWMIEIFFRVLKSGCRVEERRLETIDRVKTALAVYLIVAWRTLYLCRLARSCPQIDCETVFEPAEWKAVWKVLRHSDPPTQPPSLAEMTDMVAQLGGYVKRKNSPPGPQTIWIGLQRAHDFATCWKSFGPQAPEGQKNV